MKSVRIIHPSSETGSVWTVTAQFIDGTTDSWTILPAQALDITFSCHDIEVRQEGVDKLVNLENLSGITLCLFHEDFQSYPVHATVLPVPFSVFVCLFAWLASRVFP